MAYLLENKNGLKIKTEKGVIALITVLVVMATALLIGISINLLSINETKMSLQAKQSAQAHYLSSLCAEEALMNLKEDVNYSGSETITNDEGDCTILPIENNWIIKVSATSLRQVKKMKVVIEKINPKMVISSWQEVGDF